MLTSTFFNSLTHARQGMFGQELQDAHIPPRAGHRTVELLQRGAEVGEARRQRPVAKSGGGVERTRLAATGPKVVNRMENHEMFPKTSIIRLYDPPSRRDGDPIDV